MKRNILLLIIFMFSNISLRAVIVSLEYNTSQCHIYNDTIFGKSYSYVVWGDAINDVNAVGMPSIPIFKHIFALPQEANIEKIESSLFNSKQVILTNDLLPVQYLVPTNLENHNYPFAKNDSVYDSSIYPINPIINYSIENLNFNKYLTIEICPLTYSPLTKKLTLYSKIDLDISVASKSDNNFTIIETTFASTQSGNQPYQNFSMDESIDIGLPFYEYVIITNSYLKSSFERIANWKHIKGYNVGIIDIADILNNNHLLGDTISNIYDNAGKLRQYLIYSLKSVGTKYVLFGGNSDIVPIRYGTGYNNAQVPSDWYYSNLSSNWNVDGDNLYGEYNVDSIGSFAEIAIGRVLCQNPEEVSNWINKAIRYEINPGRGSYDYLTRALFTEADEMQNYQQASQIGSLLSNFTSTIIGEVPSYSDSLPSYPKGSDIISMINSNHYGLLSNFNHGNVTNYCVTTPYINGRINNVWNPPLHSYYYIHSIDSYGIGNYYAIDDDNNGFNNLNNTLYPSVMYSISCLNMPFDDINQNGLRNLGDVFTCISSGGGPAYLGNTRDGFTISSFNLYKKFINALQSNKHIGVAENLSKSMVSDNSTFHHLKLSHNLLGCPETSMWTSVPQIFTNVVVQYINGILIVNTNGINNCKITVTSSEDYGQAYYKTYDNISSMTFTNVPQHYNVVITKENYIPYIYSYNDLCFIQDETIENDSIYDGCEKIEIGYDVNPLHPFGNVEVKNGGKLEIENANEIIIKNNFSVELGGELIIQ